MRLAARECGDVLHEIEHTFRRAVFPVQHGLDDFRRLGLGEPALAQEALSILPNAGDDQLARGLDTGDERRGGRIGEVRQGRCRFMSKALRSALE